MPLYHYNSRARAYPKRKDKFFKIITVLRYAIICLLLFCIVKMLVLNYSRTNLFLMFIALGCMLLGVLLGFLLRRKTFRHIPKVITLLIWFLLFVLGVEIGGNPRILSGLGQIGVEALVITLAAVVGSALAALLLWKYIQSGRKSHHEE